LEIFCLLFCSIYLPYQLDYQQDLYSSESVVYLYVIGLSAY